MNETLEQERFMNDLARFSGHYQEFLVIAKSKEGRLQWHATDSTWASGACRRYLSCIDELDREDERKKLENL